jgi:predicted dehydrogenase
MNSVMDPTIKIGIIGCGGMARSHIRRILGDFQNTEIVAVSVAVN